MFVGRDSLVAEILGRTPQEPGGFDLRGALGAGQDKLAVPPARRHPGLPAIPRQPRELQPRSRRRARRARVGRSSPGQLPEDSPHCSTTLIEQACPDDLDAFSSDVVDAYNSEVVGWRVYSIEEARKVLARRLEPKDLADLWRAAATAVAESFVPRWNAVEEDRLLLLDNVDEIADQEMGAWLGQVLVRLDRTAVVFTSQVEDADAPCPLPMDDLMVVKQVPPFDQLDVDKYLRRIEPTAVLDPDRRTVYEISGGHPGTVTIVHNLLWRRGVGPDANREDALHDLPESPLEKVAVLVQRLVERLEDPPLLDALWASVVPRRFNAKLLKSLLGPSLSDHDHRRIFDDLTRFPFVESLTSDGALLRIHSYVRQGLLERLRRIDRDRYDELHESAADYYNDVVFKQEEDESGGGYGNAYIYEKPEWQLNKREWLYHRGHASSDPAKRQALVEFARIFLEAFWWWGNYVHFDFCDQLVADLAQLARQRDPGRSRPLGGGATDGTGSLAWPELDQLHHSLKQILQLYPPRSGKTKDAQWDEIRDTLLAVKEKCGLLERRDRPRSRTSWWWRPYSKCFPLTRIATRIRSTTRRWSTTKGPRHCSPA